MLRLRGWGFIGAVCGLGPVLMFEVQGVAGLGFRVWGVELSGIGPSQVEILFTSPHLTVSQWTPKPDSQSHCITSVPGVSGSVAQEVVTNEGMCRQTDTYKTTKSSG